MIDILTGKEMTSQDAEVVKNISQPKRLTLSEHPSEVCKCGSKLFVPAFVIKDIDGMSVGDVSKKKVPFPVETFPVYVCAKCGELAPCMTYDDSLSNVVEKLLSDDTKIEN